MSSASRLAWLVTYCRSASVIASYVASWLCAKLTKACVKCRSSYEQVSKASVAGKPAVRIFVCFSAGVYTLRRDLLPLASVRLCMAT